MRKKGRRRSLSAAAHEERGCRLYVRLSRGSCASDATLRARAIPVAPQVRSTEHGARAGVSLDEASDESRRRATEASNRPQ